MTTPVFLVASRRSGTTLFRLMMNGHPAITWQRGWEVVADAVKYFDENGDMVQQIELEGFESIEATDLGDLKNKLNQNIENSVKPEAREVFGATVHVGFKSLHKAWPEAKFIHLIRDPRDIAISHIKLGWSGHYYFAADPWKQSELDWNEMQEILPDSQFIDLKYENLVASPESELKRVCEFLEVEYTDKLFSYIETSKYSYPKKELAYRWKDKLNDEQVQLVESGLYELMQTRGYEPSLEKIEYTESNIKQFSSVDVWTKRKNRINEKGLWFVLISKLARDTRLPFLVRMSEKMEAKKHIEHLAKLEKNY